MFHYGVAHIAVTVIGETVGKRSLESSRQLTLSAALAARLSSLAVEVGPFRSAPRRPRHGPIRQALRDRAKLPGHSLKFNESGESWCH